MVSSAVAFSSSRLVLAMHVYIPWSLRFTFIICSLPSSNRYLHKYNCYNYIAAIHRHTNIQAESIYSSAHLPTSAFILLLIKITERVVCVGFKQLHQTIIVLHVIHVTFLYYLFICQQYFVQLFLAYWHVLRKQIAFLADKIHSLWKIHSLNRNIKWMFLPPEH